jgi:Bacterial PH domain
VTGAESTDFAAAPLDRSTKLTSAAVVASVVGITLTIPVAEAGPVGTVVGIGLPIAVLVLGYGLSPRGYRLQPGRLQILRRWFGSRTFRIDKVSATSALFGLGGIRLAGSGGAFGWYGLFWRKGSGRYHAYVTDRSQLVVCDGPDGVIVLSPAEPRAFLEAAGDAS